MCLHATKGREFSRSTRPSPQPIIIQRRITLPKEDIVWVHSVLLLAKGDINAHQLVLDVLFELKPPKVDGSEIWQAGFFRS